MTTAAAPGEGDAMSHRPVSDGIAVLADDLTLVYGRDETPAINGVLQGIFHPIRLRLN